LIRDGRRGVRKEKSGCCFGCCANRFGDLPGWAEERLRCASSAMLETWSERILTASTLDEVFSEQNG
jgi:hypothetical protein